MIEDRLTHNERIRLESLSQAVAVLMSTRNDGKHEPPTITETLKTAERIEVWLKQANGN